MDNPEDIKNFCNFLYRLWICFTSEFLQKHCVSDTVSLKLEQPACVWFLGVHAVFLLLHLLKQFLGAGMELEHIRTQLATVLRIAKTFYPQIWIYLIYFVCTAHQFWVFYTTNDNLVACRSWLLKGKWIK